MAASNKLSQRERLFNGGGTFKAGAGVPGAGTSEVVVTAAPTPKGVLPSVHDHRRRNVTAKWRCNCLLASPGGSVVRCAVRWGQRHPAQQSPPGGCEILLGYGNTGYVCCEQRSRNSVPAHLAEVMMVSGNGIRKRKRHPEIAVGNAEQRVPHPKQKQHEKRDCCTITTKPGLPLAKSPVNRTPDCRIFVHTCRPFSFAYRIITAQSSRITIVITGTRCLPLLGMAGTIGRSG